MIEYFGAIRVNDAPEMWALTDNIDSMIAALPDRKMFVTSIEELLGALDTEDPAPHPFVTHWKIRTADYGPDKGLQKVVRESECWLKPINVEHVDLHELAVCAKKVTTIRFTEDYHHRNTNRDKLQQRVAASTDPLVGDLQVDWYTIKYVEGYFRSKQRSAKRKAAIKPYVTKDCFAILINAFRTYICPWISDDREAWGTWYVVVKTLKRQIRHMEVLFGEQAYRRVVEFQKLCKDWRTLGEETKRRIEPGKRQSECVLKEILGFFQWLDGESKKRMPKTKNLNEFRVCRWRRFPEARLPAKEKEPLGHNT